MTDYGRVGHRPDEKQWQIECLARYICEIPFLAERRRRMFKLREKFGTDYFDKLSDAVEQEWERRRNDPGLVG